VREFGTRGPEKTTAHEKRVSVSGAGAMPLSTGSDQHEANL
jgi:hypothetical protein